MPPSRNNGTRRRPSGIHWTGWLVFVLGLWLVPLALQTQAADRPNIIFVLADDMGYGDVGCYNPESKIPTPHMDRLAREGIRFTDAHTAAASCTPSRYALLTGRYCWRTSLKRGVLFNYEPPLIDKERLTLASLLQQEGYATAMVGKWHLGLGFSTKKGKVVDFHRPLPWDAGPLPDPQVGASIDFSAPALGGPSDLGFDHAFYTAGCSTDQEPFCFIENRTFLDMEKATYRHPAGSWRSGMAAPSWINETVDVTFTEKAIGWITESRRKAPEKPFFLYLALSAPHSPHLIPDFAAGKSQAGVRGDMVWLVDWCVGRIAQALDDLQIEDTTLLMVSSDNGPLKGSLLPGAGEGSARISNGHKSAGDLRGYKSSIHEGGHRVPFIARWPDEIPASTTTDQPLCLVDLLATCAAIVGVRLPKDAGEDSFNLLSALRGRETDASPRGPLVHHSGGDSLSTRKGAWKIILRRLRNQQAEPVGETQGFLYNLEVDPRETTDRWNDQPEVVEELSRLLETYQSAGRTAPVSRTVAK